MLKSLWDTFGTGQTTGHASLPCPVCKDLNVESIVDSQGAASRGLTRLNLLSADVRIAAKRGCKPCAVIYHGLTHLSYVLGSPDYTADGYILRCLLSEDAPLRLKVYAQGNAELLNEYEFHTVQGSRRRFGGFGPETEVAKNPLEPQMIAKMKAWIEDCMKFHSRCESVDFGLLPTRVLNVGLGPGAKVRLEETGGTRRGNYVALSHCWGPQQPTITTKATLESKKAGIEWRFLPQTFRDVIQLTRKLGIEYLWIDSLCILQDDEADWASEAARMGTIYEGSYVTISATSAANSSQGCFSPASNIRDGIQITSSNVHGLDTMIGARPYRGAAAHSWLMTAQPDTRQSDMFPTLTRGWCFQERLLASRVLHFTSEEIVFECKSRCRCECGGAEAFSFKAFYVPLTQHNMEIDALVTKARSPSPPPPGQLSCSDTGLTTNSAISSLASSLQLKAQGLDKQRWRMLVEHYANRQFTHLRDVLPALSALAQRYHEAHSATYLAGLWSSHLPWDLLWFSERPWDSARPLDSVGRNTSMSALPLQRQTSGRIYTAPTFSWASRVGAVAWTPSYESARLTCSIVAASCTPATPDKFGEVADGSVTLRGPAVGYKTRRSDATLFAELFSSGREDGQLVGAVRLDTKEAYPIVQQSRLMLFCVVIDEPKGLYRPVTVATALILRPSNAKPGTYRRLGILQWCDAKVFEGVLNQDVTIV